MSSHGRSSRHAQGKWEGHDALHAALQGLASAKGTSQNRISAVAKLALQYAKFYKHVVHDVEMFLWKAEPEHRLAGLYAIDAIIRQGGTRAEAREQYAKRFGIRLADTLTAVKGASAESQSKVRQVVEEWQRRGIYSPSAVEVAGGYEFALRSESPTHSSNTPTASSGKLASLLSIIKKKKEQEHDHPSSGSADQRYDRDDREPEYDAYDRRDRLDNRDNRDNRDIRDSRQQDVSPYRHQDRHFQGPSGSEHRDQRPTQGIMGDAPPSLLGAGPPRAALNDNRTSEWNDDSGRTAKKQRSSRWGPPKPAGEGSAESRPPPIVTSTSMDNHSRFSGDVGSRQSPPRIDSRASPSFYNAQDGFHPPSSDDRRPESYGRYDGAPPQPPRHNGPSGLVNHGFSSIPEDASSRYMPGSGSNPAGPSPRFGDRSSPQQQQHMQITGNQQHGGSGEICRKFLGGRCTFGDRCWHIHDPQVTRPTPPSPVATEAKRKTVLCNNFPIGRCRYGDKCSFAHGVEDLGSVRPQLPPASGRSGFNESPRGRWDSASSTPSVSAGNPAPSPHPVHPSSSGLPPAGFPPQHLPRQNGAGVPPQAVFNEPQDGRRTAGATTTSNGGNIGSGAPPSAPPYPMRLQGPAAPFSAGPPPRGPPVFQPSGYPQAPRAANFPGPPAPPVHMGPVLSGGPQHAFAVPAKKTGQDSSAAGRLDDDDEPEAPVEEFTLQYDDED